MQGRANSEENIKIMQHSKKHGESSNAAKQKPEIREVPESELAPFRRKKSAPETSELGINNAKTTGKKEENLNPYKDDLQFLNKIKKDQINKLSNAFKNDGRGIVK